MKNRVVLLGKGELAVRFAQWFHDSEEHELWQVVPVLPEPDWSESLCAWCDRNGVPWVESGHYKDLPGARDPQQPIHLAFSVFYAKIIRPWFIDRCNRILNLHNSALPRYRGTAPINWALKNGERVHGVTIHEITPGIDDGPIVSQLRYSIYPEFDEVIDVYRRALRYGYELFAQTLPILDRIEPVPQNEEEASYYGNQDLDKLGDRNDFTRARSLEGAS